MEIKLTETQRREMILNAGCRIVANQGLWAINHSSVASRCSAPTSARTVRRIMGDKDALWSAIIDADGSGLARKQAMEMGWNK